MPKLCCLIPIGVLGHRLATEILTVHRWGPTHCRCKVYFTGNMLSKYEACTDSLKACDASGPSCAHSEQPIRQDIINTDGDNEETWEKFDEHFTKLHGQVMFACAALDARDGF